MQSNTKLTKLILAVGLQLVIILCIIGYKFVTITSGTAVLLKIHPIDPTDPLRGDYVIFQYDISSIKFSRFNFEPKRGDSVFVYLRKSGDYWYPLLVNDKKVPQARSDVFLKGKVISLPADRPMSPNSTVGIVYGIEEYFIPEGAGRTFSFRNRDIAAEVVVDDNGNAVLTQLFIDGKKWP